MVLKRMISTLFFRHIQDLVLSTSCIFTMVTMVLVDMCMARIVFVDLLLPVVTKQYDRVGVSFCSTTSVYKSKHFRQ